MKDVDCGNKPGMKCPDCKVEGIWFGSDNCPPCRIKELETGIRGLNGALRTAERILEQEGLCWGDLTYVVGEIKTLQKKILDRCDHTITAINLCDDCKNTLLKD